MIDNIIKIIIGIIIFGYLTTVLMTGCVDKTGAEKALSDAGFSNIQTGEYEWFSCSKDDFYHTKFTANNPKNEKVSGVVCGGLFFKKSTIRF